MELQVTIKNHYGKDFIYPHCKQSEVFAILTGKKTLTENDIHWIKTLGYTFKIIEILEKLLKLDWYYLHV